MMKNSEARSLSKRYFAANAPPTGRITINKTPKNRYFTNASRHSFCFFAVAYIASFMFKFCLYLNLRSGRLAFLFRSRSKRILAKFTS